MSSLFEGTYSLECLIYLIMESILLLAYNIGVRVIILIEGRHLVSLILEVIVIGAKHGCIVANCDVLVFIFRHVLD